VASLLVLQDPTRRAKRGRWLAAVRPRLGGQRLDLLTALAPAGRFLPCWSPCTRTRPPTSPLRGGVDPQVGEGDHPG
jgi:hypothetical protein